MDWTATERQSPFLQQFPPAIESGHWCPGFWYAKPFLGCAYHCKTCFVHRLMDGFGHKPTVYTNAGRMRDEIDAWLDARTAPALLAFGTESGDLVAIQDRIAAYWCVPFWEWIVALADRLAAADLLGSSGNELLICTKSDRIDGLLSFVPRRNLILSWSVNGVEAAARWERKTPPMSDRLAAVATAVEAGWRVRLRVDPILIDMPDYLADLDIIRRFCDAYPVERITLGVMRVSKRPRASSGDQVNGLAPVVQMFRGLGAEVGCCKISLQAKRLLGLGNVCNCTL